MISDVKDKNNKLADDTNPVTAYYQWTMNGMSPSVKLLARPQSNNKSYDFNLKIAEFMLLDQLIPLKREYKYSFLGCAKDGASCDSEFVVHVLLEILDGNISYYSHTNMRTSVYQADKPLQRLLDSQ